MQFPLGSNWARGVTIASQVGSVPIFLRKHITTCDFPLSALDKSMHVPSIHVTSWSVHWSDIIC